MTEAPHSHGDDDALGVYLAVPFCRAKCSFCNFASDVFAGERLQGYVDRLLLELDQARSWADTLHAALPRRVDTVYLGGGTPSLLEPAEVERLFAGLRRHFQLDPAAEITVEAAPGQLSEGTLLALRAARVNRLSFGVQSFVDRECARVGRTHTGASCRAELDRVRQAGFARVGVDLIAGLPGQTFASWRESVEQAVASGVGHVSVYMLEVDDCSRLGREVAAGGRRYGAGELPDEDRVAGWYEAACEWLGAAGVAQYEISNFARAGEPSRHNLRYWQRRPYLGLGLDAHSMLPVPSGAVRWSNGDSMDAWMGRGALVSPVAQGFAGQRTVDRVGPQEAFEESLFLGLRLVEGVHLDSLCERFGPVPAPVLQAAQDCHAAGLLELAPERWRLTARGRMASNEVFERLLVSREEVLA